MAIAVKKSSIDLGLVTTNLDAMKAFYHGTLGLPLEAELELPGGAHMTRLLAGESVVKLVVQPKTPGGANPPGGLAAATGIRYFTITISGLDAAVDACKADGYAVPVGPVAVRPGINIAMIEDPDGNWVELLEAS